MTVAVINAQPFIDAIKAAVTGVAYAEGRKPTVAAGSPYVVAWFDSGSVTDISLAARDGFEIVATFECYGSAPDSVRFAVRKVRAAVFSLAGQTVGGRLLQMPENVASPSIQRDDDVQPPLWWQPDVWRFRTYPA